MRRRPINKHLRLQVLMRDGSKCRICGRPTGEVSLEVDHIVAVAQGGSDELSNLAALCHDCNAGKSDYRFSDYISMRVLPDDIESYFEFFHDPKQGSFERYHLYCYFKQPGGTISSQGKSHHEWTIADTDFAVSSNPKALEARRKLEGIKIFKDKLRCELAAKRKRLIVTEEGLEQV